MLTILFVLVFLLGAIVGSFLNVLVVRLGTGLGVVRRGSFCFSCGKALKWRELIPILSFLMQKGKCRNCKARISIQYPIVETINGFLFVLIFAKIYLIPDTKYLIQSVSLLSTLVTLYYFVIFSLLLAISAYDIRHKIIPNQFVYLFIALSFIGIYFLPLKLQAFFAAPLLALPFVLLWFVSKGQWMGLGDAKLAWGIGWLLGISSGVVALTISFWIGALVSVGLIGISKVNFFKKHYTIKSEIPFGPFLVLGMFLVWFFEFTLYDIISLFVL